MKDILYLIDANAILYRSFFAFIKNHLRTKEGFNTSAIFGTINTFIKLTEKFGAKKIAVSFDLKEKTFRHELDATYKANRPPMPAELVSQIEPVKEFFRLVNVPEISLVGFEADDVLASLATKFKTSYDIVLVTGDKDYFQLVEDGVSVYDPMKDKMYNKDGVFARYGLTPQQIPYYLALMGDASDNIPGVRGIGEKGAQKLLQEFGTLDNIYTHLEKIGDSLRKKLKDGRESAYHSLKLALMAKDIPLPVVDLNFNPHYLANAVNFYQRYELHGFVKKYSNLDLFADYPAAPSFTMEKKEQTNNDLPLQPNFVLVENMAQLNAVLQKNTSRYLAFDSETTGLDALTAEPVGISFCYEENRAYYLPVGHKTADNLPLAEVINAFNAYAQNKTLIGHNLKYDLQVLERYGLIASSSLFDTMIAAYLLDASLMRYSLDACMQEVFKYTMIPITELIGSGKNQIGFEWTELHQACRYAAEDAWATYKLFGFYAERLRENGLLSLFEKIEMPLMPVLKNMEKTGVYIEQPALKEMGRLIEAQIGEITQKIYQLAGKQFNIGSTQQLAQILFEDLGIKHGKKTKTGFSTDVHVLEDLKNEHPLIPLILDYRLLSKLSSTYVGALPKLVSEKDGRLHTSFNQTVASTGRLSSSNPNLQNIPVRSKLGREIRKSFAPQKNDWLILAADYSQIELRLLAAFSKDENLLRAFKEEKDIHAQTAEIIFDLPLAEVGKSERAKAKTINFGIIYGMGARKLAGELDITQKEAKIFIENYFAKFPTIKNWMDEKQKEAKVKGYAETIFGRRLYLPNINSSNLRLKSEAERVAVNMPIQGSAADLIKLAMIEIAEKIKERTDVYLILQVHDELVFEVKKEVISEVTKFVRSSMEGVLPTDLQTLVRLKVETGVGSNWYDAH